MTNASQYVGVKCTCCESPDKTVLLDLVGNFRRMIYVWRCDQCGLPCSNHLCPGFQPLRFEDGHR